MRLLSTAPELRINGSFTASVKVKLTFHPPIFEGMHYDDVTQYPIHTNPVVLRLRAGRKWRKNAGLLHLTGVDSGPHAVTVNRRLANVVDTLVSSASVVCSKTPIYHDAPLLTITGSGFMARNDSFVFADSDFNPWFYTINATSESTHALALSGSRSWRRDVPTPLTLLSVKADAGYAPVGPANSFGCEVAMVFKRPSVRARWQHEVTRRTATPKLEIRGEGFPPVHSNFTAALKFDPPLIEGLDYYVSNKWVFMELVLLPNRAWRHEPGELRVTHINTLGTEDGWVAVPNGGVCVSIVLSDDDIGVFGPVKIFSSQTLAYQSTPQIVLNGTGFVPGMSLSLSPPLREKVDYTVRVASPVQTVLTLTKHGKWRADKGMLLVKSIRVGGTAHPHTNGTGICVRVILVDNLQVTVPPPRVPATLHATQSKLLTIDGIPFISAPYTTKRSVKLKLSPEPDPASYRYPTYKWLPSSMSLQLTLFENRSWLPAALSFENRTDSSPVPLWLLGVDTGAGAVLLSAPILLAHIIPDIEGVSCRDTCIKKVFNGVCDDPTHRNYSPPRPRRRDKSTCPSGTDCTDCGGVESLTVGAPSLPPRAPLVANCSNTCIYSMDGECDDPRGTNYCAIGEKSLHIL